MSATISTFRTHPSSEFVDAVVAVAVAHGTTTAATWSTLSRETVNKYRREAGAGLGIGVRRHPTERDECAGCPMCDGTSIVWVTGQPARRSRPTPPAWMDVAPCRGMDPDIFFPHRGDDCRPAKLVCAGCPFRVDCLEYALAACERHGVWGGMSERERRRLRRDRARAARAAA